jgi:hypothetical protein
LELVKLRTDLPEKFADTAAVLSKKDADWQKIRDLCIKYNFKSILKDLPDLPAASAVAEKAPSSCSSGLFVEGELFFADECVNEKKESTAKENSEAVQGELF